jgi:hypothetical protein
MYDGLTPELYTEFQFLKTFPLQHLDEQIAKAISCAFKERRTEDVKPLKDQRVALGYTSAGVTAAEMRERLTALLEKIDDRYDYLAEREDEAGCEVCVDCQVMVFDILDLEVTESGPESVLGPIPIETFDDRFTAPILEVDDRDGVDSVAESMRSTVLLSDQ